METLYAPNWLHDDENLVLVTCNIIPGLWVLSVTRPDLHVRIILCVILGNIKIAISIPVAIKDVVMNCTCLIRVNVARHFCRR